MCFSITVYCHSGEVQPVPMLTHVFQRIDVLVKSNQYQDALALALSFYEGKAKAVIGLPASHSKRAHVVSQLVSKGSIGEQLPDVTYALPEVPVAQQHFYVGLRFLHNVLCVVEGPLGGWGVSMCVCTHAIQSRLLS